MQLLKSEASSKVTILEYGTGLTVRPFVAMSGFLLLLTLRWLETMHAVIAFAVAVKRTSLSDAFSQSNDFRTLLPSSIPLADGAPSRTTPYSHAQNQTVFSITYGTYPYVYQVL
jgi:hypothetical protein